MIVVAVIVQIIIWVGVIALLLWINGAFADPRPRKPTPRHHTEEEWEEIRRRAIHIRL